MNLPDGYLPIMPYLVLKDAFKFISFTKEILGATLRYDAPREEGIIMHAELQIEDAVIMFCDATEVYLSKPAGMFLYLSNSDKIHDKVVAAGYKILTPLDDRPYGRGFGFADEWENQWWINTPLNK